MTGCNSITEREHWPAVWLRRRCVLDPYAVALFSDLYADYLSRCGKGQAWGRDYFRRAILHAHPQLRYSTWRTRRTIVGLRLVDAVEYPTCNSITEREHAAGKAQREHWPAVGSEPRKLWHRPDWRIVPDAKPDEK